MQMAQAVEEEIIVVRRQRAVDAVPEISSSPLSPSYNPEQPNAYSVGWTHEASSTKFSMLDIPWFHPDLTRHQAEAELRNSEEGVYLLRPRVEAGEVVEGYSLEIRSTHSVKHFRINVHKGRLIFGQETFSTLASFLEHFQNYPLIGDETGHLIVFKHPYPRDVDEIHEYSDVLEHFIPQGKISREISATTETKTYSCVSKEGYLVKMGNIVKTWKRRWFVLNKEELCYFAKERNKNPIRVINIREVTEVTSCDLHPIHMKQNVFRVVLPWRTFFLQAPNPTVREEWLHVLEFKLNELSEAKKRTTNRSETTKIIRHH